MANKDSPEEVKDRKKPSGEKRKHSESSSLRELDRSNTSFENHKTKEEKQGNKTWLK